MCAQLHSVVGFFLHTASYIPGSRINGVSIGRSNVNTHRHITAVVRDRNHAYILVPANTHYISPSKHEGLIGCNTIPLSLTRASGVNKLNKIKHLARVRAANRIPPSTDILRKNYFTLLVMRSTGSIPTRGHLQVLGTAGHGRRRPVTGTISEARGGGTQNIRVGAHSCSTSRCLGVALPGTGLFCIWCPSVGRVRPSPSHLGTIRSAGFLCQHSISRHSPVTLALQDIRKQAYQDNPDTLHPGQLQLLAQIQFSIIVGGFTWLVTEEQVNKYTY